MFLAYILYNKMKEKESSEFSEETIEYLSKLALIDLSDREKKEVSKQLNHIINHFKRLNDLDTTNVEPLRHPIEDLKNVFREDKVENGLNQEEALKNVKNTKEGYIKAPRILKE
ncbi:MAG: Asp-tRNA(Asn)/Glu-tRNA(Gln) amidotransferase subunit GatC [Promethearchaeota archaeon]|nr:MAG: Asp-tRNA(Asn)/Glu-tRNA(Gln) amidotransferase subunit GatC [Candidatus Lokiarchaeota archaeon]